MNKEYVRKLILFSPAFFILLVIAASLTLTGGDESTSNDSGPITIVSESTANAFIENREIGNQDDLNDYISKLDDDDSHIINISNDTNRVALQVSRGMEDLTIDLNYNYNTRTIADGVALKSPSVASNTLTGIDMISGFASSINLENGSQKLDINNPRLFSAVFSSDENYIGKTTDGETIYLSGGAINNNGGILSGVSEDEVNNINQIASTTTVTSGEKLFLYRTIGSRNPFKVQDISDVSVVHDNKHYYTIGAENYTVFNHLGEEVASFDSPSLPEDNELTGYDPITAVLQFNETIYYAASDNPGEISPANGALERPIKTPGFITDWEEVSGKLIVLSGENIWLLEDAERGVWRKLNGEKEAVWDTMVGSGNMLYFAEASDFGSRYLENPHTTAVEL